MGLLQTQASQGCFSCSTYLCEYTPIMVLELLVSTGTGCCCKLSHNKLYPDVHTKYYSGYIIGKHSRPPKTPRKGGGRIPFKPKGPLATTKLCQFCCRTGALNNALAHAGSSWQGDGGACALFFFWHLMSWQLWARHAPKASQL